MGLYAVDKRLSIRQKITRAWRIWQNRVIEFDDEKIVSISAFRRYQIAWNDVTIITAELCAFLTYDEQRISICDDTMCLFSYETERHYKFVTTFLEKRFPDIKTGWYGEVETSEPYSPIVLWERDKAAS